MPRARRRWLSVIAPLGLAAAWTFVTWLLEGRIRTFSRPDAIGDRLAYVLVANLGVGLGGAALLVHHDAARRRARPWGQAGPRRTSVSVIAGLALGVAFFFASAAPSTDPWVMINAHAQAWPVTVAEIAVCWWALGTGARAALPARRRAAAALTVALGAVVFGLYHFGHSPPFDTWAMVGKLTFVGVATGLFFVLSRDVWGTALFHNWAAIIGITGALAEAGVLEGYRAPRWPTLAVAAAAFALLLAADRWARRPGECARAAGAV